MRGKHILNILGFRSAFLPTRARPLHAGEISESTKIGLKGRRTGKVRCIEKARHGSSIFFCATKSSTEKEDLIKTAYKEKLKGEILEEKSLRFSKSFCLASYQWIWEMKVL